MDKRKFKMKVKIFIEHLFPNILKNIKSEYNIFVPNLEFRAFDRSEIFIS